MILPAVLLVISGILTSTQAIEIKLNPGQTLEEVQKLYPDAKISPLFTLPREKLVELSSLEEGLPDLTLWYSVTVPIAPLVEQNEEEIAASLESLDSISAVEIPRDFVPPNIRSMSQTVHPKLRHNVRRLAVTGDFVPNQGYLRANTPTNNGIDAEYSWTFDGGDGEGVTIYDVEYGWNQLHEDLEVVRDVKLLLNASDEADDPFKDDHGTAVLGEMVGTLNTFGVKGISHGAKARLAPEKTKVLGNNRGNAILLALNDGKAGDIILFEIQTIVCGNPIPEGNSQDGYGPAEESLSVFEVTQVATAKGITVVAAAGNGNVDLDAARCEGRFDRNVRDSGAVIVGAGGTGIICPGGWNGAPREKLPFSTFGSRLDVHGWGECIWTTGSGDGYKDPDALDDKNKWYTLSFGGTSGASPIVAGAAANIQGIAMKRFGAPLKPKQLRQLLTDTGLPQLGDISMKIGPLVNLRAAIDNLLANSPTMNPTANPTSIPTNAPTTISPTSIPTNAPTTISPTSKPSNAPTTISPTSKPTSIPSNAPTTISPTGKPTLIPTNSPTTIHPTGKPTGKPTDIPTISSKSGKASEMPFLSFKSGKEGKSQKANKTLGELI